jgi:hypothetical protein
MFLDFPFEQIGFSEAEWEQMPRNHKVLIRDFALNGYDDTRTVLYDEYQSDYELNKVKRKYKLSQRPVVHFSSTDFCIY